MAIFFFFLYQPFLIHFYTWPTEQWPNKCTASSRHIILKCSFLPMILTSSYKGKWFPFSFHIWSAIPNFSTSPWHTAFQCSSSLSFSEQYVLLLPWLHRIEYMQFWLCCILLGVWLEADIFEEFCHSWILSWYYILNLFR